MKLRRAAASMKYSPAVARTAMPTTWLSFTGMASRHTKPPVVAKATNMIASCSAESSRCREKRTCKEQAEG